MARRRPLAPLDAWRLDGPRTVAETLRFVAELQDIEDQRALPAAYVPGDHEPRWRTRVNRWFGR
jgi:hypothetical protein